MRLSALAPGDVAAMPKGLSKLVRQPAPESALEVFLILLDYQMITNLNSALMMIEVSVVLHCDRGFSLLNRSGGS